MPYYIKKLIKEVEKFYKIATITGFQLDSGFLLKDADSFIESQLNHGSSFKWNRDFEGIGSDGPYWSTFKAIVDDDPNDGIIWFVKVTPGKYYGFESIKDLKDSWAVSLTIQNTGSSWQDSNGNPIPPKEVKWTQPMTGPKLALWLRKIDNHFQDAMQSNLYLNPRD